ncbi:major facilitator superfamily protein [Bisporella sp. PMI_857]|nr:major facilitator superfamily protein [Bisporella sp. PMI_857]KAH8600531.1 major facilitator superfamily protein [Bisporella sp. PMI_857]
MASSSSEPPKQPSEDLESGNVTPPLNNDEDEHLPFAKIFVVMIALYLSMFIVALDRTILGTAIPSITDEFHAVGDIGWYGSSYLLTASAFQLVFGRIYTFYSAKWTLLTTIGILEIGSLICAVAPNSTAFIVGRAISKCCWNFNGCVMIMVSSIPLHKRPMYQGVFGAVFGVASVAGPLVGGAFTTNITWRWCFWINLPVGGLIAFILLFILKNKSPQTTATYKQQFKKLDPYGTIVFLPGIVCLILALQWGGATTHGMTNSLTRANARIIVLFILAGILLIVFCIIQVKSGENATVQVHIIKQRSILSGFYFQCVSAGCMMTMTFYLPLWFQAIKGVSAVRSGIYTLPFVLSLVVASIFSGILTQKSGYYVPQLISCSIIMSIGAGLVTTFKVHTNSAHWIGYQVVGMAAQTCLPKKEVSTGVALMFFGQGLGGSIFLAICQAIFNDSLVSNLKHLTSLDPSSIVRTGATDLRDLVPVEMLSSVLEAYNKALTETFKVAVGCAVAGIISGLTMEWRSVKKGKQTPVEKEIKEKDTISTADPAVASDVEIVEERKA